MTNIQRWGHPDPDGSMHSYPLGPYVLYADHVEAVRQAAEEALRADEAVGEQLAQQYEQGQRDARVEAAKVWEQMSYDTGYAAGKASMRRYLMADDENTYAQSQRDALAAAVTDLKARVERERSEGDPDGLLDGLRYALDCLTTIAAIKGGNDE